MPSFNFCEVGQSLAIPPIIKIQKDKETFLIYRDFFIRAVLALFSNAAYHAPQNSTINVQLKNDNDKLYVIESNNIISPEKKPTSKFTLTTRGVLEHCVKFLGGEVQFPPISEIPKKGPFESSFWIPISTRGLKWIVL